MKLREFNFNNIRKDFFLQNTDTPKFDPITHFPYPIGLSIGRETSPGKVETWYDGGSIGETLKQLPLEFADAEIKETRWFFNTFVIELKGDFENAQN